MEFHPLSLEQRRAFHRDGYLLVRNALEPQVIERLVSAGDELIASDRSCNRQDREHYDGFRNTVSVSDAFVPLITAEPVLPYIVQLMGIDIHLITSHLIYKSPRHKDTPPHTRDPGWHRDIDGTIDALGHDVVPRLCIKCAYYLTDATVENCGNTLFVRGSHKLEEELPLSGDRDPEGATRLEVNAGDCVFFENRTWHAGEVNLTDRTMKQIMIGYGYRFMKPMDWAVMDEHVVEQLDDIGRQLVGRTGNPGGKFRPGSQVQPLADWCKQHGVDAHQYHNDGSEAVLQNA